MTLHPVEAEERLDAYAAVLARHGLGERSLVTREHDTYRLIIGADLVVVQHSNVGVEASILDRPVLSVVTGERTSAFSLADHGFTEEINDAAEAHARIRALLIDADARSGRTPVGATTWPPIPNSTTAAWPSASRRFSSRLRGGAAGEETLAGLPRIAALCEPGRKARPRTAFVQDCNGRRGAMKLNRAAGLYGEVMSPRPEEADERRSRPRDERASATLQGQEPRYRREDVPTKGAD